MTSGHGDDSRPGQGRIGASSCTLDDEWLVVEPPKAGIWDELAGALVLLALLVAGMALILGGA